MKNYGKKLLSVLLAALMCVSVFTALDLSGLVADAYTASPTHTYYFTIKQGSVESNYDGRDGDTSLKIWGKNQNGNGSETVIYDGTISGCWAYASGSDGRGDADTGTFSSAYFPTKAYIGIRISDNSSAVGSKKISSSLVMHVKNEATGGWVNHTCFDFSFTSSTNFWGSGSTWKDTGEKSFSVGKPTASKVATAYNKDGNATDTVNVTINATGGENKTQNFNAYVYDQYNVIWTAPPSSWEKTGTTACTTSLSYTDARESNTLTMSATNTTYQKAACTVTAKYGSMYHKWNVNITPTYKVSFDVATNGGTSTAPTGTTVTNTNTSSANTSLALTSDKTAEKVKNDTGTWTFVGWNGSPTATSGVKPTGNVTIDHYNDTLYAIFSRSAKATFYWYTENGSRTSKDNEKTVYNKATQFTFNIPGSSEVPRTITANGTTYTFAGWALGSTTSTTAKYGTTATTATENINTGSQYNFYALYTGSVTLSYDKNGGSGQPEAQTADLTLNCGANASAASNTSGRATFTLNPAGVAMSRYYSSKFVGWKTSKVDANGIDSETAQYKDGTVNWAASNNLQSTITINKNTTVYATYYDFRYVVRFKDYKGDLKEEQEIRHNFSATAPDMPEDSAHPSHTDTGSHYVFDHWEYTDGTAYSDSDKLTKLQNGYVYDVWGKYVGHKHIWGEPYGINGVTTCTSGMTYYKDCTVCGYSRQFEEDPLSHAYELIGVAEPTCTKNGSWGKYVCQNCGDVLASFMVDSDGDGIEDFEVTEATRIRPALGHKYGVNNGGTWTYIDPDNLTDPETGAFLVEPNVVEATCTTAGYYYYTCSRCDDEFKAGAIPATGHAWVTVDPIEATCTEGGHQGYTKCSNCGLFLDGADEDTEALGHAYVLVEETASTCTAKGHYAYYECSRCGAFFDTDADKTPIADISVKDKDYAPHDYQFVDHVDPTCTEPGYTGAYLCSVCHQRDPETEPGEEIPALGHVWERDGFAGFDGYAATYGDEYVEEYESPNPCLVASYVTYTCPECGETHTLTDALTGHTPVFHEGYAATCTAEGRTDYWECEVCGKYFSDENAENEISEDDTVIAKIPHTLITIDGEAPTCTEPGIPDCYKCTVCEKLFLDSNGKNELTGELGTIPALGHNWTAWVISTMPTDTEPGVETHRCIRCGDVETRPVEALGHEMTHINAKAATCTAAGNNACWYCESCGGYFADEEGATALNYEEDVYVAALGHNIPETPDEYEAPTCAAEGYRKFVCSRCGDIVVETLPKIAEHGEPVPYGEDIPATCAAVGMEHGTMCSLCGEVLTRPTLLAKLPHTPESSRRDACDATCTGTGYTGDLYCAECGQKIETGVQIEASGHTLGALTELSAATCTSYGLKKRACAHCDYYETYETPVLGHQVAIDAAKAATCTEAGLTEGKHCSRCGVVLVAQEEVPMLGHNYIETVVAPTCTALGYTVHTCEYCRDTYRDTYTDKIAHVEGTAATCENAAVCAVCGRSYGDPLGHDYVYNAELSIAGTCVAVGTNVYKCTRCGETRSEATDYGSHDFTDAQVTYTGATCTQPGTASAVCNTCGQTITEEFQPALGHDYVNGRCTRCGETDPNYVPPTPADNTSSQKCEKCGLNHNGRTGLWKQDGFFCKIIGFFRSLFRGFGK